MLFNTLLKTKALAGYILPNKSFRDTLCFLIKYAHIRVSCHAGVPVHCTRACVITFLLVFPWRVTFTKRYRTLSVLFNTLLETKALAGYILPNKSFRDTLCFLIKYAHIRVSCHADVPVHCTRARVITFLLVFPWRVTYALTDLLTD